MRKLKKIPKKRFRRYIKRNKFQLILVSILFIFPLIVGLIYYLPVPQFIAVDSAALLTYYGTAFGIFSSFLTYRHEKIKEKKARNHSLMPKFLVEVTQSDPSDENNDIFNISITNLTENNLFYLFLYDEPISKQVPQKLIKKVAYYHSSELPPLPEGCLNITPDDPEILDSDKWPKYVQLVCDDIDGNCWNCCYFRTEFNGKTLYYPREVEIV